MFMALIFMLITGTMSVRAIMGMSPHEVTPEDVNVTFNDVKGVSLGYF